MIAEQVAYEIRRQLALRLRSLRLHRIHVQKRETGECIRKSRRRLGGLAVVLGNVYLRMQRANVSILSDLDWIRWEREVEFAVQGDANMELKVSDQSQSRWSKGNRRVHVRRYVPGVALQQIVGDSAIGLEKRIGAIVVAFRSLRKLHAKSAAWRTGLTQAISHGDATCGNVIIDIHLQRATWIDFDMRHLECLDAIERHADDVRSLMFSVAACIPTDNYRALLEKVFREDWSTDLRDCYSRLLASQWQRPTTFQLAQAPLKRIELKHFIEIQQELLRGAKYVSHNDKPLG